MTSDELRELISNARWFERAGSFPSEPGFLAITSLSFWDDENSSTGVPALDMTLGSMVWLPQSPQDPTPLEMPPQASSTAGNDEYRLALASLRSSDGLACLRSSGHDYSWPAMKTAAYAMRLAAKEIDGHTPSQWCAIARIFCCGNWPLGVSGDLVVVY